MVSLKLSKMNLKRFQIRGKKDKAVAAETTAEGEIPIDPIMEEREDAMESNGAKMEDINENDERSPVADSQEPGIDDNAGRDTTEAPLSEEDDMKPADDKSHPIEDVMHKDVAQSMDEDLTLDAENTSHQGCPTPANTPAFCGCFAA